MLIKNNDAFEFYYVFADPNIVQKQFNEMIEKSKENKNVDKSFDIFATFLLSSKKLMIYF
ncbi:hypothetical protein [Metamycoplasma canadense]|uniref:hypothetical protein n=1 Tax=Metamycoplasma canadense TaxID=29554 RepID=UPI0005ED4D14|nr:hypothetical protein [Metamycoplasma canadense]